MVWTINLCLFLSVEFGSKGWSITIGGEERKWRRKAEEGGEWRKWWQGGSGEVEEGGQGRRG